MHKKNLVYDQRELIIYSVFFSFLVELLIRGYGYFSPGVFIYISSVVYWMKYSGFNKESSYKVMSGNIA